MAVLSKPRRRAFHPLMGTGTPHAVRWFALAVASLAVSGTLSLVLVAGRIPLGAAADAIDPALARRSLVVHVNLAMGVWFLTSLAGLFCLLPARKPLRAATPALALATLGVLLFVIPVGFRSATPILSNYVPALDHPLFLAGLIVFAAAVVLNCADIQLWRSTSSDSLLPPDAQVAVLAAVATVFLALLTIAGAFATLDSSMSSAAYYEQLFWGGGHVLQTANTMGMLSCWLILLHRLTGRLTVSRGRATLLFAVMLLPTLAGPWLTLGQYFGRWFTRMMQYGIFPVTLVFIACAGAALWRHRRCLVRTRLHTLALVGLSTSIGMTLAGFVLGAMIVADTTLTPAHYHANIGAVTIAYMTTLLVLLPALGAPLPWPHLAAWQPLVYAAGQMLFVIGLAIAGTLGHAPRKTYGAEQPFLDGSARVGLAVVGVGGLLALGGGTFFVIIMARAARGLCRTGAPDRQ